MSATSLIEPGGWTFDDPADAELPLDLHRYEVVDGCVVVRPEMTTPYELFASDMAFQLNASLPPGWRAGRRKQMGSSAADVAMLGEVVSAGGRRTDRVLKPAEYAAAGVPAYWLVDLEPEPLLVVHRLVEGAYVPEQQVRGSGRVTLALGPDEHVAVDLDLAALLPPMLD